ncbi:MAG: hypothetical protein GC161_14760 [Planctomycetaceae bacterium]|nr:hypothetical protein [Planctomycetaceae bacterium]
MKFAHGFGLAAALLLLGGGLWHLGTGGTARRASAVPDIASPALASPATAPSLSTPTSQTASQADAPAATTHAAASFESPTPGAADRAEVVPDGAEEPTDRPDAEMQLDLGLVNLGASPVETDRSALARDAAPQLAAELGWKLTQQETQLFGTWLAGHERRARRVAEAERGRPGDAAGPRTDLDGWFESFDALFGAGRGDTLRQRLERR